MGIYSRYIFPWGMDRIMSAAPVAEQRPIVLSEVVEPALEIGFGTGLNLGHYPSYIRRLSVLDPNPGMNRRANRRIAASSIEVDRVGLADDRVLEVDDAMFESVVTTWTLCSIPDVSFAISEIFRVLRPGGRFFFIEHGLSPDTRVAKWQHRLNGLQQIWACGCRLNRDIRALIGAERFTVERCDQFYMKKQPRFAGYTYRGVVRK